MAARRAASKLTGSWPCPKLAVCQQAVLLLLSSLLLDGGHTFRVWLIAACAHWTAIGLIIGRRSTAPTKWDLGLIRYAYVPFAFLAGLFARIALL